MKLYLSSYGLGNFADVLHEMVGTNKKMLFVDNAKDALSVIDRKVHVDEKKLEWQQAGFGFEELDLRDYFDGSTGLKDKLRSAGLIWMSGGNTFVLRRAMKYSGLDTLLPGLLAETELVYGGSSAGSIVATPSLHGTEHGDDPFDIPTGYQKTIIWDGLSLVPTHLVPHSESPWFYDESVAMERYMKEHGLPYVALKDGEVYAVDGEKAEYLK